MTPLRFHPALVTLHWLLAAAILFSLAMGTFSLTQIPNDSPDKVFALRGHMALGIAILALMVVRLAVRLRTPHPARASSGYPLLDRLAAWNHYALYALAILLAASGIALSLQAGLPGIVFGGSQAPLPASLTVYPPRIVHGVLATVLMVLITVHVLAALYHQFVRRDRLFTRVWFGRR